MSSAWGHAVLQGCAVFAPHASVAVDPLLPLARDVAVDPFAGGRNPDRAGITCLCKGFCFLQILEVSESQGALELVAQTPAEASAS